MAGWLQGVRDDRHMPWLKRGMRIELHKDSDVKKGRVTGGNAMANIQVRFDGESFSRNCHPHWQMVYYDPNGNVLADYRGATHDV
jgi:hypothetical protein